MGARVRPLRTGAALAAAALLTALVVTPSVAATLPSTVVTPQGVETEPQQTAPTIVFGDHSGHVGYEE